MCGEHEVRGGRADAGSSRVFVRNNGTAMTVNEFYGMQGDIMGSINQRRGMITNNSTDGAQSVINADVPLAQLFGYSTDIRSQTQGKGEFTMEYKTHTSVMPDQQAELVKEFQARRAAESAGK